MTRVARFSEETKSAYQKELVRGKKILSPAAPVSADYMAKFFSVGLRAPKFFSDLALDHVSTKLTPAQRGLFQKNRNAVVAVLRTVSQEYIDWHDHNQNPSANHPLFLSRIEIMMDVLRGVFAEASKGSAWLLNPTDRQRARIFSRKGDLYKRRCLGLLSVLKIGGFNISKSDPPVTFTGGTKASLLRAGNAKMQPPFREVIKISPHGAEVDLDALIPQSVDFLGEVFRHMAASQSHGQDSRRQ